MTPKIFAQIVVRKIQIFLLGVLLAVWCMLLFVPITGHAEELHFATVTQNALLRETPDSKGKIVAGIKADATVLLLAEGEGWSQIRVDGYEGYLSNDFLAPAQMVSDAMEELEKSENANIEFANQIEVERRKSGNARIWGGVLLLVIAGVVGSGGYMTIRNWKQEREEKEG